MNRTALIAVLLPIAVAAIAVPAWRVATYKLPPSPPALASDELDLGYRRGTTDAEPSKAQIARWQKIADASCKCVRRGGQDGSCWAQYESETAPYSRGDWATMCMPITHSGDCFGGGVIPDKCVETDRSHNRQLLCTTEERQAMEAAWNRELAKPHGDSDAEGQRAFDRAGAAMDRVYQRILRGESLAGIKGPAGCGG